MSNATAVAGADPRRTGERAGPDRGTIGYLALLGGGLVVLTVAIGLGTAVGARAIPPATVWDVLLHRDGGELSITVWQLRLPRTLLAGLVGLGLGLGGVLMQALTGNPLADPGIFGINAGASLAVVCGVVFLGFSSPAQYLPLALAGAGITAVAVYLIGSAGRAGPADLALGGVAVAACLQAITQGFTTINATAYDAIRYWLVGTVAGRDLSVVRVVAVLIVAGAVLAVALAPALNALSLGDDVARSLGARPGLVRALGAVAVLLLCGAATAAAGPITFVGLAVAHALRPITGPDHRRLLPAVAVWGPCLVILADVLGRVIAYPAEVPVSVVLAFVGAPVFVLLLRRARAVPE